MVADNIIMLADYSWLGGKGNWVIWELKSSHWACIKSFRVIIPWPYGEQQTPSYLNCSCLQKLTDKGQKKVNFLMILCYL